MSISPDELCVERAPSLALSSLPRSLHHPVLMNHVCQPVPAAVTQHVAIQEDQLALRPVEPVVVGICDGHGPLESCGDGRKKHTLQRRPFTQTSCGRLSFPAPTMHESKRTAVRCHFHHNGRRCVITLPLGFHMYERTPACPA